MKKTIIVGVIIILISIVGLSFMANNIPPNIISTIERDIKRYIEENEKYVTTLEILEVSDIMDMYSPFENIIGMHWVLMDISTKSGYGKIKPEYQKDFLRIEEFINNIDAMITLKYYTDSAKSANRRGVICKYRLNGVLEKNAFYYENDNSKIGHDFKMIEKRYSSLFKTYIEVKYADSIRY